MTGLVVERLRDAWAVARGRAVIAKPEPVALLSGPPTLPDHMLSRFFAKVEAGCRDGTPLPVNLVPNAREVALELDVLREAVGRPVRASSWWRSAEHNGAVGSKDTSQHRLAKAVDVVVAGMSPAEVFRLIEQLIATGQMRQGGLGLYPPRPAIGTRRARVGFVHYDCRGTKARWTG